ncbi:MAG: hypothetical protein ABI565_04750 [Vicinamibacteria bacterium]
MKTSFLAGRRPFPWAGVLLLAAAAATLAPLPVRAGQGQGHPMLLARMSRWQGDPVKKRKGPPGFDIQFRLVGARFDGAFGVEGVPQTVPEGEPFDAQIKLTNIGSKRIKISAITVTGESGSLATDLLTKKVNGKTSVTVASFKVPAQSSTGAAAFQIMVLLSNGDRHTATLSFSKPS